MGLTAHRALSSVDMPRRTGAGLGSLNTHKARRAPLSNSAFFHARFSISTVLIMGTVQPYVSHEWLISVMADRAGTSSDVPVCLVCRSANPVRFASYLAWQRDGGDCSNRFHKAITMYSLSEAQQLQLYRVRHILNLVADLADGAPLDTAYLPVRIEGLSCLLSSLADMLPDPSALPSHVQPGDPS